LIARIITNGANLATITNLANKNKLEFAQNTGRLTDNIIFGFEGPGYGNYSARRENNTFTYNFARTPVVTSINAVLGSMAPGATGFGIHGVANVVYNKVVNRNFTRFNVLTDYHQSNPAASQFYCEIDFQTIV